MPQQIESNTTIQWTLASIQEARRLGGVQHYLWLPPESTSPIGTLEPPSANKKDWLYLGYVHELQKCLDQELAKPGIGEALLVALSTRGKGARVSATPKAEGTVFTFTPI